MKFFFILLSLAMIFCSYDCADIYQLYGLDTSNVSMTWMKQAEDIEDLPASYFLCKITFKETLLI